MVMVKPTNSPAGGHLLGCFFIISDVTHAGIGYGGGVVNLGF